MFFSASCSIGSRTAHTTSLKDANVKYISERVTTMVYPSTHFYSENKTLYIGELKTVVEESVEFLPTGKAAFYEIGGSEGMIRYTESISNLVEKYRIATDLESNFIVYQYPDDDHKMVKDIDRHVTKTIVRDFVIIEDLKIIMPKRDFDIYEQQKKRSPNNRTTKRIVFYYYN